MKKTTKIAAVILALSLTACTGAAPDTSQNTQEAELTSEASLTERQTSEEAPTEPAAEPVRETADTPAPVYNAGNISLSAVTGNGTMLVYTIDEETGCAYTSVTYSTEYVPDNALAQSVLTADAEHGECFFGETAYSCSADLTKENEFSVTDENGITKNYKIITERTEGLLPIVSITLDDGLASENITRNDYIGMTLSIDCSKSPEYPSGIDSLGGKIRGRGNSTWKWDKKPYKIKLDEKAEILGLPANKDWILLANYADKSLLRNTVAYEMGKAMSFSWTPTQYPVDLFINGEYQGVYSIGEHMEVAENRVNITKQSEDSSECGYLLEVGGADSSVTTYGVDYFHTNSEMLNFITFEYPSPDKITDEQRSEIMDLFNAADNAIVNGGDIGEYIDIDSFVDWIIIQELTNNTDSAFRRSCYFTKDVGGKIKMGPIWDFDLAFGNYVMDNPSYNSWTVIGSDGEDAFILKSWGNYLMENPQFRARLKERWEEVRDKLIAAAIQSIDSYSQKIYPSQEENFKIWQIWEERVGYSSYANSLANSYELQLQYLKAFIYNRAAWIDANV